jgi:hypothetical protein
MVLVPREVLVQRVIHGTTDITKFGTMARTSGTVTKNSLGIKNKVAYEGSSVFG